MSGENLNASTMLAPDTGQNCPMTPDINVQNHRTKMSGKNKAKAKRKKRRDAQSALASESLRSAGGQGPTSLRSGLRSSLCSVEEEEGGSAPPTPPSAVSGCGAKPEKSDNPANPNLGNKGHVGESAESSVTPTNGSGGGAGVLASKSNYEEDKFNKIFFEKWNNRIRRNEALKVWNHLRLPNEIMKKIYTDADDWKKFDMKINDPFINYLNQEGWQHNPPLWVR